MADKTFIAGEWGTMVMHLHLCERTDGDLRVIDTVGGAGIKHCGDPETAFFDAARPWLERHGPVPVILAGMIGSNIGWIDTPYAPCPASIDEVAARMTRFTARGCDIMIAPGLSGRSIFDLPDVMRGEEAQLLGWLASGAAVSDRQLVCLPGMHAKWAIAEDGRIISFFTSMTGELFEVLVAHSLVGRNMPPVEAGAEIDAGDPAFVLGLDTAISTADLAFEHAIFSARSQVVTKQMAAENARAYLSGLLIGCEVRDAIAAHRARGVDCDRVSTIGGKSVNALYGAALTRLCVQPEPVDAPQASLRGLTALLDASLVPA